MRLNYPTTPILGIKADLKSAYRRIHCNGTASQQCIVSFKKLLLMWLRLSFGGSGCPTTWCAVGEAIVDLANDIVRNCKLQPEHIPKKYRHLVQPPTYDNPSTPFHPAKPIMLKPPPRDYGYFDIFVDDIIGLLLDIGESYLTVYATLLLAVLAVCRPSNAKELLPRDDCLHYKKTFIEGAPSEIFVTLGWKFDTRKLTLQLPPQKLLAWTNDVDTVIKEGKINEIPGNHMQLLVYQ
jgi:hypothetical protein